MRELGSVGGAYVPHKGRSQFPAVFHHKWINFFIHATQVFLKLVYLVLSCALWDPMALSHAAQKHCVYQQEKDLGCINKKIDPLATKHSRQLRCSSSVWSLSATHTTSFSGANTTVIFLRWLQGSLIICHRYWHMNLVPIPVSLTVCDCAS